MEKIYHRKYIVYIQYDKYYDFQKITSSKGDGTCYKQVTDTDEEAYCATRNLAFGQKSNRYLEDKNISLKCDNARKGKMYVTSIDKDLQYIGEHRLTSLTVPSRSIVTVVIDEK